MSSHSTVSHLLALRTARDTGPPGMLVFPMRVGQIRKCMQETLAYFMSLATSGNPKGLWRRFLLCPILFLLCISGQSQPISLTGWNRDVVLENSPTASSSYFDLNYAVWFESGLHGYYNGLPADHQIRSGLNPNIRFQLQRYDQPNVLWMDSTNSVGRLKLTTPESYVAIYILAASANFGGSGSVILHFADGSQSTPLNFFAPDWWEGSADKAVRRAAALGFARNIGLGPDFHYDFTPPGFSLHQTDLDLRALGLSQRALTELEFRKANGTNPPVSTSIFAVSGISVNDAAPRFRADQITLTSNFFSTVLEGLPGLSYVIETSSNLMSWRAVQELTAQMPTTPVQLDRSETNSFVRAKIAN